MIGEDSNATITYGFPVDDNCYGYIPAAEATTTTVCFGNNSSVGDVYAADSDFYDMIEILAHSSDSEAESPTLAAVVTAPIAMPVAASVDLNIVDSAPTALLTYAIPAEEEYEKDKMLMDWEDCSKFDDGCDGSSYSYYQSYPVDTQLATATSASVYPTCFSTSTTAKDYHGMFEFGAGFLKDLEQIDDEKKIRRNEAIFRWQQKKQKKTKIGVPVRTAEHSVYTSDVFPSQNNDAVPVPATFLPHRTSSNNLQVQSNQDSKSSKNARQEATARREREQGKFKKAQIKWVSVSELFKPSFSEVGRENQLNR